MSGHNVRIKGAAIELFTFLAFSKQLLERIHTVLCLPILFSAHPNLLASHGGHFQGFLILLPHSCVLQAIESAL